MAYLITHFWPGPTVDEYNATVAAIHPLAYRNWVRSIRASASVSAGRALIGASSAARTPSTISSDLH